MGKLLDFLFGKPPDIFDANGAVRHKLKAKKWEDWNNRIVQNPEYDWKEHSGNLLGETSAPANKSLQNPTPPGQQK